MTVNADMMDLFPNQSWITLENTGTSIIAIPALSLDERVVGENLISRSSGWVIRPGDTKTVLKRDYDAISTHDFAADLTVTATEESGMPTVVNNAEGYMILDDGKKGIILDPPTGTNEVQSIAVDATGGTWDAVYSGQTAAGLAFNISAANLKTALEALSNIAVGDVDVTGGPGNAGGTTPYVVTFRNALGQQNVAAMTTVVGSLTGGAGTATVTTSTPGVAGTTVSIPSDAGQVAEASSFASSVDQRSVATYSDPQSLTYVRNLTNDVVVIEEVGRQRRAGIKIAPSKQTPTAVPTNAWDSSLNTFTGVLSDEWPACTLTGADSTATNRVELAASGGGLLELDRLDVVTTEGSAAAINHATSTAGVAGTNEVQTVTFTGGPTSGKTNIVTSAGNTADLAYDISAANMQTELNAVLGASSVGVGRTGAGTNGDPYIYTVTFSGNGFQSTNVAQLTSTTTTFAGGTTPSVTHATSTPGVAGTNEIQTITLANEPTGGTWTATYSGQTTSALAHNISGSGMQTALEALSNLASGDVTVARTGSGTEGSPYVYTLTFGGTLHSTNVAQLTSSAASLTQGETFTYYNPDGPHSALNPATATTISWLDTAIQVTDTALSGETVATLATFDANGVANGTLDPVNFDIDA